MRAVVLEGAKKYSVKEVPVPQADGNKVIINVSLGGVCGTDISVWKSGEPIGMIGCHEFIGTVVDPGALKETLKVGDRVTALPMDPCGICYACQNGLIAICEKGMANVMGAGFPGAFAEFVAVRPDMIKKIPDSIDDMEAALIEPMSVAVHAVAHTGLKSGDKVLITGAGIIGMANAAIARLAGASYIAMTELNPMRLEQAQKIGVADGYFYAGDPELVKNLKKAAGGAFDTVIECTGSSGGVNTAIYSIKPAKRIVLVGFSLTPLSYDSLAVFLGEIDLKGTAGYSSEDFDNTISLIAEKKLEVKRFISNIYGFDKAQEVMENLSSGKCVDLKILLNPKLQ